jgi:hypothetical protein
MSQEFFPHALAVVFNVFSKAAQELQTFVSWLNRKYSEVSWGVQYTDFQESTFIIN